MSTICAGLAKIGITLQGLVGNRISFKLPKGLLVLLAVALVVVLIVAVVLLAVALLVVLVVAVSQAIYFITIASYNLWHACTCRRFISI